MAEIKVSKSHDLCTFLFIPAMLVRSACALTPQQAQTLKSKATLAQQELKTAKEQGKDVSRIVPLMKRVNALTDIQRFKEADLLLEGILLAFDRLNVPAKSAAIPISRKKGHFHTPYGYTTVFSGKFIDGRITGITPILSFRSTSRDG